MKSFKHKGKIIKNTLLINCFQPPTIIKPPSLHVFISSMIQFDKSFHLVVVYEITSFTYSRILMKAL